MKKTVSRVLAAIVSGILFCSVSGCAGTPDVTGTYSNVIDSKTYYTSEAVKNDMPENEQRPDGSSAMVGFRRLMPMLDSRVGPEVESVSGGAVPDTANVSDYYTVTLELADGKYVLTKSFDFKLEYVFESVKGFLLEGEVPLLALKFSGSYAVDKDGSVTLGIPESVVANVSPCGQASAYSRFGGAYEDIETNEMSDTDFPGRFFYYFNTLFFVESKEVTQMTVTLDQENNTFVLS